MVDTSSSNYYAVVIDAVAGHPVFVINDPQLLFHGPAFIHRHLAAGVEGTATGGIDVIRYCFLREGLYGNSPCASRKKETQYMVVASFRPLKRQLDNRIPSARDRVT